MPTLYEHAGGEEPLHRLAAHFYASVITEPQRQRFVGLYLAALDAVGMPDDVPFRNAVHDHVEFGTDVAMQKFNPATDDDLHPLREVPHWTWAGDDAPATA